MEQSDGGVGGWGWNAVCGSRRQLCSIASNGKGGVEGGGEGRGGGGSRAGSQCKA